MKTLFTLSHRLSYLLSLLSFYTITIPCDFQGLFSLLLCQGLTHRSGWAACEATLEFRAPSTRQMRATSSKWNSW